MIILKEVNKKAFCFLITGILLLGILTGVKPLTAKAEGDTITISTYEDLLAIKDNPTGNYVLANDIDMSGKAWEPLDFSGNFDGNGHAILNVTVNSISQTTALTYDGNMISYDTYFAGFFGLLKNANVSNLKLVNEKVEINTEVPCFVGGITGYIEDSHISNCSISGRLSLTINAKMFGVGGAVGYGHGYVDDTNIDVTMVNVDTNKAERDEQFMGGAVGAGYVDVGGCNIKLKGYDSDHGYVHDGGIVGMYIIYPFGTSHYGYIKNCNVDGVISFFEDNTDRRAYCSEYIGEIMNWEFEYTGNTNTFTRDETFDYSKDLYPDMCESPQYNEVITESTCDSYGYTTYTCGTCGYSYTDNYTLPSHKIDNYTITKEPTYDSQGVKTGTCSLCGQEITMATDSLKLMNSVRIKADTLTLKKNKETKLEVIVEPGDSDIYNPSWTSSDESVATVDQEGNVKAIGKGTATITYSIDGGKLTASCNVTVKNNMWWLLIIPLVIVVFGFNFYIVSLKYTRKRRR